MEKVIVTAEQRNALDYLPKSTSTGRSELIYSHTRRTFEGDWACLDTLSIDDFARALYIGYEVEQTPEEKLLEYYYLIAAKKEKAAIPAKEVYAYEMLGVRKALQYLQINVKGINTND